MRDVTEIPLDWEKVIADYDSWIGITQCESYAITFLAKNPKLLDNIDGGNWTLAGLEVWLKRGKRKTKKGKGLKGARADLVFTRGSDYLVIEAEDSWTDAKVLDGKKQAKRYARLLASHLERKYPGHGKVLSAVTAVDYHASSEKQYGYLCGQEWSSYQMESRRLAKGREATGEGVVSPVHG